MGNSRSSGQPAGRESENPLHMGMHTERTNKVDVSPTPLKGNPDELTLRRIVKLYEHRRT
jgi:hypothetical protein